MTLLPESMAAHIGGGAKPDPGIDASPRPSMPVPIWHPVFNTDP